jgi:chromosome segregation ATPase
MEGRQMNTACRRDGVSHTNGDAYPAMSRMARKSFAMLSMTPKPLTCPSFLLPFASKKLSTHFGDVEDAIALRQSELERLHPVESETAFDNDVVDEASTISEESSDESVSSSEESDSAFEDAVSPTLFSDLLMQRKNQLEGLERRLEKFDCKVAGLEENMDRKQSKLQFATFQTSLLDTTLKGSKTKQVQDQKQIKELEHELENSTIMVADLINKMSMDWNERKSEQTRLLDLKRLLETSNAANQHMSGTTAKLGTRLREQKIQNDEEKETLDIRVKDLELQLSDADKKLKSKTLLVDQLMERIEKAEVKKDSDTSQDCCKLDKVIVSFPRSRTHLENKVDDLEQELRIATAKNVLHDTLAKAQLHRQEEAKLVFKELERKLHDMIAADERPNKEFGRKLQEKIAADERPGSTLVHLIRQQKDEEIASLEYKWHDSQARLKFLNNTVKVLNCEAAKIQREGQQKIKIMETKMNRMQAKLRFADAKTSILNDAMKHKNQNEQDLEDRLKEMALKLAELRSKLRFFHVENELLTTRLEDNNTDKEKNRKVDSLEVELALLQLGVTDLVYVGDTSESSTAEETEESDWDFVHPETGQQTLE